MGWNQDYFFDNPQHGDRPWTTHFVRPDDTGPDLLAPVDAPSPHDRLPGLWAYAGMVWEQLTDLFGAPLDLIAQEYISKQKHRRLGDWLRNVEGLVRRILLLAALTLQLAPVKAAAPRTWGIGRFHRTWWDDPLTWKVSFRVLRSRPEPRPAPVKPRKKKDPDDESTWRSPARWTRPMAKRIEALRRAIRYRDDHIRRLARRLARIKAANKTANEPRTLGTRLFDFHPDRRTPGKHAVARGTYVVAPLLELAVARWNEPGWNEPG